MTNKLLNVPYFAQNDNELWIDGTPGYAQCNVTAHAMLLAYLIPDFIDRSKKNGFREPESYLKSKFYKYSTDRGNHNAMTQTLQNEFNLRSEWRYNGTLNDIRKQIDQNKPVVIGVDYKVSGHILVVTGYIDSRFVVNDSYGIRNGSTNQYDLNQGYGDQKGKSDVYSTELMNAIWYPGEGWYRFIP